LERVIIERIKSGDINAFKALFDNHVSSLFKFLKQFSDNHDMVEDWVQSAFIKAYGNINRFEYKSKFSTWLFSIGINEMKNDYRKINKFNPVSIDEGNIDAAGFDDDSFEWDMNMKWLFEELDEFKKAVFILFEVEGYTHAEIAGMLNITTNNSRTTLSRTKQYLKQRWQSEMINND
jgi:RNA polymerase sigma-70 factor (ECF subfamily)